MRRRILLAGVLVSAALASGRAFQLGAVEGESWHTRALDQQGDTLTLEPPRGTIYDRDGVPLAASHEVFSIAVAPREIADAAEVRSLLVKHLGATKTEARRYTDDDRSWVVLPGRYGLEVRDALEGVPGVHFETVLRRFYPNGDIARELLGPVRLDGVALGGLELEFDSVLSGRAGRAVVRRDSRGRALPGAMLRAIEPVPGRDVYLTIDYDLQEIAETALAQAVEENDARGGELVMADPRTGEILAAVSRSSDGRARNWRGVTVPYEPGSTIKPFTVAALLALGRATLGDSVFAEEGHFERLKLTDSHPHEWMTLADALRESSNIGVAKLAERLQEREQYVALRSFGFGSPSGIAYPSESGGRLPHTSDWSWSSPSRLAIGYEISVTPLQMAMAYGALANGGTLLEPRLVREVRSRDGRMAQVFETRVVRRVIPEDVADQIRDVLVNAVEVGTGREASLDAFSVAGKTGTARIAENGRYRPGAYTASFAGFFPADDPQLVFIVKLDEPEGEYYGGRAAAPVTRATLEAALATRNTPIDRSAIARAPQAVAAASAAGGNVTDATARTRATGSDVVRFASHGGSRRTTAVDTTSRAIPDVSGMPMRDGVRRLHEAGFRLHLVGSGRVLRTVPAAATLARPASVIRVVGEDGA
ncbi:MAG TPA: penicillin-binding transpeptidase domain-containing protein [Longimicrobiales bacterium]|nr:penicillin-binding transpeptidase domain-containing protein [Longimicrobiales bacterium]